MKRHAAVVVVTVLAACARQSATPPRPAVIHHVDAGAAGSFVNAYLVETFTVHALGPGESHQDSYWVLESPAVAAELVAAR